MNVLWLHIRYRKATSVYVGSVRPSSGRSAGWPGCGSERGSCKKIIFFYFHVTFSLPKRIKYKEIRTKDFTKGRFIMANKKFANRKLNDQELEGVAGGTYLQSMEVAGFLGFESHDKGGLLNDNTYTEISTGKKFSQEELMKTLKDKFPGAK